MVENTSLPLTQDQILAQLMTRGFEQGFQRSPLRDFWGKLTSITGEMRQGSTGMFAVALYNFDEIEVIETVEPYTSPIGQIEISVSTKEKSKMGYFGMSVDRIINAGLPLDAPATQVKATGHIISKTLHMKLTPGHLIPSKDDATGQWSEKPTDCWTLMEIRGEGVPTAVAPGTGTPPTATVQPVAAPTGDANTQALSLLNGKTEQLWHQAVFVDPIVKANTAVIQTIISRQFITGLEAAGKITKDTEGIYHVV